MVPFTFYVIIFQKCLQYSYLCSQRSIHIKTRIRKNYIHILYNICNLNIKVENQSLVTSNANAAAASDSP